MEVYCFLVEEGTATTVVLLESKSSIHSDCGTTTQHPEPPPAQKAAQSGRPLVDLRREARERDAVSAQVLHFFLFDFVSRKLEALVRRERVGSLGLGERSGLVAGKGEDEQIGRASGCPCPSVLVS